jgi:hypothetical protein
MGNQLSEHITVQIAIDSVGAVRAGFGVGMVPSYTATWIERSRTYGGTLSVLGDFAAGTPEYRFAQSYFGQSPHPEQLIIGRAALKPTQQYTLNATVFSGAAYRVNVAAVGATPSNPVTFTSDATATQSEIHNGLVAQLNAVTGKNYTAAFAALSFVDFTFTADSTTDRLNRTAHGLKTGDGPVRTSNSGGALPTGLAAATDYFVIWDTTTGDDADHFRLATSLANALAGTAIDITSNGTGTQTLNHQAGTLSPSLPFTVTVNSAGAYLSLEVLDPTLLSIKQTHADPGTAADLAAIQNENDAWYALYTTHNSKALVLGTAAFIETQSKIYLADVNETDAITTVVSGATDTLATLFGLTYNRTAGSYYPSPAAMFGAAWLGSVLPDDPGSEIWKYRTLSGIAPVTNLTDTHRVNLRARKANTYTTIAGQNKTWEGSVAGGAFGFLDTTRGLDWLEDDLEKGVFDLVAGSRKKIPFNDNGIASVRAKVKASLKRAVTRGIINDDFEVEVPKSANVLTSDKALRRLRGVKFTATLQGAIQDVDIIGSVTN